MSFMNVFFWLSVVAARKLSTCDCDFAIWFPITVVVTVVLTLLVTFIIFKIYIWLKEHSKLLCI